MKELKEAVLKTLLFFDIFNYPLTVLEIHRFLFTPYKFSFQEVWQVLEELLKEGKLSQKNNFFYPKGQEINVLLRLKRYRLAQKKIRKAKIICSILKTFPFIKGIAICNTLSYFNAKEKSDIDLFIIGKKNLWTIRFFCLSFLKVLKQRPSPIKTKDKICLSFFLTPLKFDLRDISLKENKKISDPYLIFWLATLYPIYNEEEIFDDFFRRNSWLKSFLANFYPIFLFRSDKLNTFTKLVKRIFEFIFHFSFFESFFRFLQVKLMPKELLFLASQREGVILEKELLKFHQRDQRTHFKEIFEKKIINYENS